VLARHGERLAEAARPRCEQARVVDRASPAHLVQAVRRLERAHEHRGGDVLSIADEVQAPVDAVRAVDVGMPGRPEHRRVPCGAAAVAVCSRVVAVVGLDLDDGPSDAVDEQRRPDELRRHVEHGPGEELGAQPH